MNRHAVVTGTVNSKDFSGRIQIVYIRGTSIDDNLIGSVEEILHVMDVMLTNVHKSTHHHTTKTFDDGRT